MLQHNIKALAVVKAQSTSGTGMKRSLFLTLMELSQGKATQASSLLGPGNHYKFMTGAKNHNIWSLHFLIVLQSELKKYRKPNHIDWILSATESST